MLFLGFLLTAAFWPGISGAATAPRWALIAIAVPVLFPASLKVTWAHIAVALLTAWAALSLTWSPSLPDAIQSFVFLLLTTGAFCIGAEQRDLKPFFIGCALGLSLSSIAAIAQVFFGWTGVAQFSVPGGLFINPNMLGEISVLVLIGLVVHRVWWAIPLVLPALLLCGSRGAYLAAIVGIAAWTRSRSVIAIIMVGVAVAPLVLSQTNYRVSSIAERLNIWRDTAEALTLRGHGIGSFYTQYPAIATRTNTLESRPKHAHNDYIEIVFEYGLAGLATLLVLLGLTLHHRRHRDIPVLGAFGVMALFGFPLHMPATAFVAGIVAGHVCGSGRVVRFPNIEWRTFIPACRQA